MTGETLGIAAIVGLFSLSLGVALGALLMHEPARRVPCDLRPARPPAPRFDGRVQFRIIEGLRPPSSPRPMPVGSRPC